MVAAVRGLNSVPSEIEQKGLANDINENKKSGDSVLGSHYVLRRAFRVCTDCSGSRQESVQFDRSLSDGRCQWPASFSL